MVKPLELNQGKWWRFSAYRVVNGCVVPAPGARLQEYNPRLYHGVKVKKPSRPYVELCEVLRQLGLADTQYAEDLPSCFPLKDQGQDALLSWCSTYGLLGILLHQVSVVHLAPVWRRVKRDAVIDFPSYARMGDQWAMQAAAHWGEPPVRPRVKVGDPVARQQWPAEWRPNVLLRELGSSSFLKQEPLTETWAQFFPSVPQDKIETYPYPWPLSHGFWNVYAERLDDFVWAALSLRFAVESLSHRGRPHLLLELEGRAAFNALIAPVTRQIVPSADGRYVEEWLCPSLLSSLAEMALQDLRQGYSLMRCQQCGRAFITDAYQSRFCSDPCRWRRQKRNQRKRTHRAGRRRKDART